MAQLNLKPTHKVVKTYYHELQRLSKQTKGNTQKEGAVAPLFSPILRYCSNQYERILIEQYTLDKGNKNLYLDGAVVDSFNLIYGVWEAKDNDDKLEKEILQKFKDGYPKDNILFQSPTRAILYQNGQQVADEDLSKPEKLVGVLQLFFAWEPPQFEEWHRAVKEFSGKVKDIGEGILKLIEKERQSKNKEFITAFDTFVTICQDNINPNISIQAVEEMLIQHLLTERLFRKVFDKADFSTLNIIAHEIEKVVLALVTPHGGRSMFFKPLDRFYHAIESTAAVIHDFSEKQSFLNTVYEKFFQGFSVKVADKYGIVYTPQEVVDFMVNSVEDILKTEFGRSLSDKNVHILDPFVGTGNFIIRAMRKMKRTSLRQKYDEELHCNEVMLLPYYVASLNIEQEYYTITGEYKPFKGICFVDTFQLSEPQQARFSFMVEENSQRVKRQKETKIFVILGNPPYNVGQLNENDNNKNRKYDGIDERVQKTYVTDSMATNKNALSDVYVKAIRWASDRILESGEGVVAFITNNGFLDGAAFDGMRKHLGQDFSKIYHVDLKGNARTSGKRRRCEAGNIFDDTIRVGVGITFFIKKNNSIKTPEIYLYSIDDYLKSAEKRQFLEKAISYKHLSFKKVKPDARYTWLTGDVDNAFYTFPSMGTKDTKAGIDTSAIFKLYSNGVQTARDAWAYNFNKDVLENNIKKMINTYNTEVFRWISRDDKSIKLDDFVLDDPTQIKWSSRLKECLARGKTATFSEEKIRESLYRPYCLQNVYFDTVLTHRKAQFDHIFPTTKEENENQIICISGVGHDVFRYQISNKIVEVKYSNSSNGGSQCFPLYSYHGKERMRQENITDWALELFRDKYHNQSISKHDIFYYIYGIFHHQDYVSKYAVNLKKELPRIPFIKDFQTYSDAGKRLANLHIGYEQQDEYLLDIDENDQLDLQSSLRDLYHVKKMRLSKDRKSILYNDILTLRGIPEEVFDYRLGHYSALEWVIDQYRVKEDKRSGIMNDPNREDDPEYIIRLIQKVITVSLETVGIIKNLPEFEMIK